MDIRKKKLEVKEASRGLFNVSGSRVAEALAFAIGYRNLAAKGNRGPAHAFDVKKFLDRLSVLENEATAKACVMLLAGHRLQISVDTSVEVSLLTYKQPLWFPMPKFVNAKMIGPPMDDLDFGLIQNGRWTGFMEGWQHPSSVRGYLARSVLGSLYEKDILPEV